MIVAGLRQIWPSAREVHRDLVTLVREQRLGEVIEVRERRRNMDDAISAGTKVAIITVVVICIFA
jgi:hypothetical protein